MAAAVRQVHVHGLRIALPEAAVEIGADGLLVGRSANADVVVDHAEVGPYLACARGRPKAKRIVNRASGRDDYSLLRAGIGGASVHVPLA